MPAKLAPEQRRSVTLQVRVTEAQRALVEIRAGAAGISTSDWLRGAVERAIDSPE